jgi:hypothetical protein
MMSKSQQMHTVADTVTPQTSVAISPVGDAVAGIVFLGVHHQETSNLKSDDAI